MRPFTPQRESDPTHPTGATGSSLGWGEVMGRPELEPFGQSPDITRRPFAEAEQAAAERDVSAARNRGRAPRNFTRSDAQLREAICERLLEDDLIDPSDVAVDVTDGEVTLQGSVRRRYMKHRIEDFVDSVFGVKEIHNRIFIKPA